MSFQCDITIQCDIVSAHEEIFSGEVAMFVATGTAGELGITRTADDDPQTGSAPSAVTGW
jgi:hypothetical protein